MADDAETFYLYAWIGNTGDDDPANITVTVEYDEQPGATFTATSWSFTDAAAANTTENAEYTISGNVLTHKASSTSFYGYKATVTGAGTYSKAIVKDSDGNVKGEYPNGESTTLQLNDSSVVFYLITDADATGAVLYLQ